MENKKFLPGKTYIPVSGAVITQGDKDVLHQVVDNGWYTEGIWCGFFKEKLQNATGKKHIQLVNSGSSASLIAMKTATKGRSNKYVLTCATAFPTTVSPIYQCGKIPIYVDINPYTLEPKYEQIEAAIKYSDMYCGAIFTHTMGIPYNEQYVSSLLDGKNMFLISDCCDALGSFYENEGLVPVGTASDLSTYSFFPAHHITTGQGGAVATDDPELAELARCYSNWGRSCYCKPGQTNTCGKRFEWEDRGELPEGWDHKYIFSEQGYNFGMTEFQGALGYSQSLRLFENKALRVNNYEILYDALEYLPDLNFIPLKKGTNPFGFPIAVSKFAKFSLNKFVEYLESNRIRTRRLFAGNIIKQPAFSNSEHYKVGSLNGCDAVMNQIIWIGCHEAITLEMLDYIIEKIKDYIK